MGSRGSGDGSKQVLGPDLRKLTAHPSDPQQHNPGGGKENPCRWNRKGEHVFFYSPGKDFSDVEVMRAPGFCRITQRSKGQDFLSPAPAF